MTTLVAALLTAAALGVILAPVLRRRRPKAAGVAETSRVAWLDRYRGSLADLQDAELDWQVGNLSDADYATVHDEQRQRAAEALRQITLRETILEQVRAEVGQLPRNGVAHAQNGLPSPSEGRDRGAPALGDDGPPSTVVPPRRSVRVLPTATPILVGGAAALVAVAAVVLLYLRLLNAQAAQQPLATLPIEHAHAIVVDSSGLWVGHHGGMLRSADGQAWRTTPASGDIMAIVSIGSRRLAFGHDSLLGSDDGGSSWAPFAHDLPGTDVHGAQVGARGIYAYVVGFGVFRSVDGSHWEQVGRPLAEDVGGLAVLPSGGDDVLYLNAGGALLRSVDSGITWGSANGAGNLALSGFVNDVAADPNNSLLYAGTSQGLFRSSSGGADWTRLPFRGTVTAVGADGARVAVVDDRAGFFLSTDGGGTWTGGR